MIGGLAGLGKAKVKGDEYEEFWNRLSDNTTEITTKVLEQYMKTEIALFLIMFVCCLLCLIMITNPLIFKKKLPNIVEKKGSLGNQW